MTEDFERNPEVLLGNLTWQTALHNYYTRNYNNKKNAVTQLNCKIYDKLTEYFNDWRKACGPKLYVQHSETRLC